ncbi:MAG: hypothetical protein WD119_02545 [Pirellulaceae bacterium]
MSNPYAIPDATPAPSTVPPQVPHYSAMVQQVPVFAILLMVHGGIVILMGLGLGVIAAVIPMSAAANNAQGMDADEEMMLRFVSIGYGVAAAGIGVIGVIHLWSGWKTFLYQRRILGFVGIGAAFFSSLTCYCALTGIPLGIWGLILLLHPDVQHAYELAKNGMTRNQIIQHFSGAAPPPATQPTGQPPAAQAPPEEPPPTEGV